MKLIEFFKNDSAQPGWFLASRDFFGLMVLLYVVMFVVEHIWPGFVSDFFELNLFLGGLIILAIFLLIIKKIIK